MKRSPMPPRRKALKRSRMRRQAQTLQRRAAPIRATGKRRFPKGQDDAYLDWVRTQPCLVTLQFGNECQGPIDPHHVRSRGAGGADRGNVVPLCRRHHEEGHQHGWLTFQWVYDVDLGAAARDLEAEFLRALLADAGQPKEGE